MNRIKELRTKLSYTQLQMAEILGIKQNAYSSIETGKVSLTDRNRTVLESKFHLTPGWLQGDDVSMFIKGDAVAGIIGGGMSRNNRERLKEQILEELVDQRIESQNDSVSMSREVFEQISRLTETVLSQQRTIESMQEQNRKFLALQGMDVRCAHVSGSDISTNDIKNQNINKE